MRRRRSGLTSDARLLAYHHPPRIPVVARAKFVDVDAARRRLALFSAAVPVCRTVSRTVDTGSAIPEFHAPHDVPSRVVHSDGHFGRFAEFEGNPRLWVERVGVVGQQPRLVRRGGGKEAFEDGDALAEGLGAIVGSARLS